MMEPNEPAPAEAGEKRLPRWASLTLIVLLSVTSWACVIWLIYRLVFP